MDNKITIQQILIVSILINLILSLIIGGILFENNKIKEPIIIENECPEPVKFDYKRCPIVTKIEPIENCYIRILEEKQNLDTLSIAFEE